MRDIMGLMKQAQQMQSKMAELQAELDATEVQGQAGAGMVTLTMSAKGALKAIHIDPSLM
jgi:DNA-binding YbaB/EbfC family protein